MYFPQIIFRILDRSFYRIFLYVLKASRNPKYELSCKFCALLYQRRGSRILLFLIFLFLTLGQYILCSPFGKNEDHIPSSTQIFEGCFYFKESKCMHLCPVVSNKRLCFLEYLIFFFFFYAIAYFDGKFRKDFCRQRMT